LLAATRIGHANCIEIDPRPSSLIAVADVQRDGARPAPTEMAASVAVGIIGAGPAGLLLAQLLARRGIASRVLERSSREHVEGRIRAGVLEQPTVDTLRDAGVGARLAREGIVHHGNRAALRRRRQRIDFRELVPGRTITVYGQREVVRDSDRCAPRRSRGGGRASVLRVSNVEVAGLEKDQPVLSFTQQAGASNSTATGWSAVTATTECRATGFPRTSLSPSSTFSLLPGSACWRRSRPRARS
jgi:hypothetical protein